jgi:hypothetical protein
MKNKACKVCKAKFTPIRPLQAVCSPICAYEHALQLKLKKDKAETKKLKESLITHSDYLKMAQTKINVLVRLIDYGCLCISCGGNGKPQSGHYHSTQSKPELRFNLHNIHIQDYRCNVELSANIVGYNDGLIKTYGIDYKNYVENGLRNEYKELKLSIPEIQKAIEITSNIIKNFPKEVKYNSAQRIELRNLFNKEIGIY